MTESALPQETQVESKKPLRAKAEWLELEARNQSRHPARARLLLAASELRAMVGDMQQARRLAHQALALRPGTPLVERQVRGLSQLPQQADAHLKSLKREAAAGDASTEIRSHALYVAGEIAATCKHDAQQAHELHTAAEKLSPGDIRPFVALVSSTASQQSSRSIVDDKAPAGAKPSSDVREAGRQLLNLQKPVSGLPEADSSMGESLLGLARSLRQNDRSTAAQFASQLSADTNLGALSNWLIVVLNDDTAAQPGARMKALRALSDQPGPLASQTLAREFLRAGDHQSLEETLSRSNTPELERALLRLLTNRENPSSSPEVGLDNCASGLEVSKLIRRMAPGGNSAEHDSTADHRSADEKAYDCGRAICEPADIEAQLPDLKMLPAADRAALQAKVAHAQGNSQHLAQLLPQIFQTPDSETDSSQLAESHFAAALLLDSVQQPEAALHHYRNALGSAATQETSIWEIYRRDSEADLPRLLGSLAKNTRDAAHRAIILTQALYRLDSHSALVETIADQATQEDPRLPLAARIAEQAARDRGDRTQVAHWMAVERENTASSREEDLSRVREALAVYDTHPEQAIAHLASLGANSDLATQEWREQLDPNARHEAAAVRLGAADRSDPISSASLFAEAACWYESTGDLSAAAGTLEPSKDPLGIALWEMFAEHNCLNKLRMRWQAQLKDQLTPEAYADQLLRLAQLEARNLNFDGSDKWFRLLAETGDTSLRTLRFAERTHLSPGKEGGLLASAVALGQELPLTDRLTYAFLVSRLQTDSGKWQSNEHLVDWLPITDSLPRWAVRLLEGHCPPENTARKRELLSKLLETTTHELDQSFLYSAIAEIEMQLEQWETALESASLALQKVPQNLVALRLQVRIVKEVGMHSELAEALTNLAGQVSQGEVAGQLHLQAAEVWFDTLGNDEQGVVALRAASKSAPCLQSAQLRIRDYYLERKRPGELREFALAQLEGQLDEQAQISWSISLAQALIPLGEFDEALKRLTEVLLSTPENTEALNLNAAIYHAQGESGSAIQLWHKCLESNPSLSERLRALRGLVAPGVPVLRKEKRTCYEEILELDPDDQTIRRQLIRFLIGDDETRLAIEHQEQLLRHSSGDSDRLEALLQLIELHEKTTQGEGPCAELFAQAHRTWPDNSDVLAAEVQHYRQTQRRDTAQVVIERSLSSARSLVGVGRFDPSLLRTVEIACRLNGDDVGERLARATLSALRGKTVKIRGLDAACGNERFEHSCAPSALDTTFRKLWLEAGEAVEHAFISPTVDALSLGPDQLRQVQAIATGFGLDDIQVLVSDTLGCVCIPLRTPAPTLIFGQSLLVHENVRVRDFLLLRALKLLALNGCALSAMTPERSWATVAGFIACYTDAWNVSGNDAQHLIVARDRIRPFIRKPLPPQLQAQLPSLSAELLPAAAQTGTNLQKWACRTALLGVGEVSPALLSLWLMSQTSLPMPTTVEARAQWIAGNDQASDLLAFSVSEEFAASLRR